MRKALLAAFGAWALALAATAFTDASWLAMPMAVVALGVTALWLAHICAFALRTTMAAGHATRDISAGTSAPAVATAPFSRRQFAAEFARVAVFAAIATALSARANTVLAQGRCDCSKCRSDQNCCPTANGYCGCFPVKCP
jgi:hypothetical protein